MTGVDNLLSALRQAGAKIKGKKVWCPFHEDDHSSGGIYEGRDGRWHYHCFACRWNRGRPDGTANDVLRTIGAGAIQPQPEAPRAHPPPADRSLDFQSMYATYPEGPRAELAARLDVGVTAVADMGYRQADRNVWALPVYSPGGAMIGIQLRGRNGRKWCVRGTSQGLFVPHKQPEAPFVAITEGASDATYLLGLGIPVVARFSAQMSPAMIVDWLDEQEYREIVVIADKGEIGIQTARRLANATRKRRRTVRLLIPAAKDIRAWALPRAAFWQVARSLGAL